MNENERIIAQKKLPGESKYDVCYECLDRTGKSYKDIQPMFYVTTLEERDITTPDGETFKKKFYGNHYFCPLCKKSFTADDFRIRYTVRADRTKWTESPRMKGYVGE